MSSSLMATPKTLEVTIHDPLTAVSLPSAHLRHLAFFPRHGSTIYPLHKFSKLKISASVSQTLQMDRYSPIKQAKSMYSGATLLAVAATASKFFPDEIFGMATQLREPALSVAAPAFFAAMKTRELNTPFTEVAAGMAKWLEIYGGALSVRVMLKWDKQPLSAIRDLCDPYLNLFRRIIPLVIFGYLDVSLLSAFAVLGTMASILNSSRHAI